MPRKAVNITGNRYGRVLVLRRNGLKSGGAVWRCRCDCGKEFDAFGHNLRKGDTTSCGCFRSETTSKRSLVHGHIKGSTRKKRKTTKTYRAWSGIKSRCLNSNNPAWSDYGGRGIRVCRRWHKFTNFLQDMGESPLDRSIDRINNDGNYCRSNCRWATRSQQMKNRRPSGCGRRSRQTIARKFFAGNEQHLTV